MERKKYNLSAEEIIVLAGLLGYKSILAVEDNDFYNIRESAGKKIARIMGRFESEKEFFYDFNGVLNVNYSLKQLIDTICCPDNFIVLDGNIGTKKKTTTYIVIKNDNLVTFQKKQTPTYDFEMLKTSGLEELLSNSISSITEADFHERIDCRKIISIQENILSFREEEGINCLRESAKSESSVEPIVDFLSKRDGYTRIQIYKRTDKMYFNKTDKLLATHKSGLMMVSCEKENYFRFDSVSSESVIEELINIILG